MPSYADYYRNRKSNVPGIAPSLLPTAPPGIRNNLSSGVLGLNQKMIDRGGSNLPVPAGGHSYGNDALFATDQVTTPTQGMPLVQGGGPSNQITPEQQMRQRLKDFRRSFGSPRPAKKPRTPRPIMPGLPGQVMPRQPIEVNPGMYDNPWWQLYAQRQQQPRLIIRGS